MGMARATQTQIQPGKDRRPDWVCCESVVMFLLPSVMRLLGLRAAAWVGQTVARLLVVSRRARPPPGSAEATGASEADTSCARRVHAWRPGSAPVGRESH